MLGSRAARAGVLAIAVGLSGAAGALAAPRPPNAPLRVVATIEPLCMLVRALGGERVACTTLVPPGANPHAFEPRPSTIAAVAEAKLLLRAGNGVDDWAARLAGAGDAAWAVLGPACPPEDAACAHFWLDPKRTGDAVASRLAPLLVEHAPAAAEELAAQERLFGSELLSATYDALDLLAPVRGSAFVAFHPAWGDFARFFGLVDLGAIQAHGAEEPTPRRLAELLSAARAAGVRAVLIEPQQGADTARIAAEELGARVVMVDPLGDPRDPERASYTALLRWNARQLAAALAGEEP